MYYNSKQPQTFTYHKLYKSNQFYHSLLPEKKIIICFGINYEIRIIAREFPIYSI